MKKVMMVMPHMVGGGAERVAALLVNYFSDHGLDAEFVLTADRAGEVVRCDLKEEISLRLLREELGEETAVEKLRYFPAKIASKIVCRVFEKLHKPVPAYWAYLSLLWQHHREIKTLRNAMLENPEMTVVSFLQPAIPVVLLAGRGLPNRIIISERCDSKRLMKKRYGKEFIKKYYPRANEAVFQTEDARDGYPEVIAQKGRVIPNPIKENLPLPYTGERKCNITTFCRISEQKNLMLLVDAFHMLHQDYPEYILRIIGDAPNDEGKRVVDELTARIEQLEIKEAVHLLPFSGTVHEEILQDCMYVNSSDYEGMSNAMLEAMAIGMPVVCTDCPIGGARAIIRDGENGLLVPVGDPEAMYRAMKRIIEDKELARRLSVNAAELRETLSLESIAERWMELL